MTAPARPAATVVLARDGDPLDLFFVRRHARSGFMANAYVFPGGRVDGEDAAVALRERLHGVDPGALTRRMQGLDEKAALAHLVAGIRETFEEAGLLLARSASGEAVDLRESARASRLARWREGLNAGEARFEEMIRDEDLMLDGGALRYFDHWITPTQEPRRYDTRFFLARAPARQEGRADGLEVTHSVWRSPADALEAHGAGRFHMAPPTWCVLRGMAGLPDAGAALRWAEDRGAPAPVLPHLTREEGHIVVAMPGDPLHPGAEGPEAAPRRVVLRDGRWSES